METSSQELSICSACKNECEGDANFCEQCGTKLKDVFICEHCKAENDGETKFCDQCGTELDALQFKANQRLKTIVWVTIVATFFMFIVAAVFLGMFV